MALSEFELETARRAMDAFMAKRRPPEDIRKEVDLAYTIKGQSIEIMEVRPHWRNEAEITRIPFAKATYVASADHWKVFWMRASGKWEAYPPQPLVSSVEEFANVVDADSHYCFFG